jgi:hypothetical protein
MRLLTRIEKEAIRNSPCGGCGAAPPFQQWGGARCHPHRIKPGSKGGQYTKRNTTPRCPRCHDLEHGGSGTEPFSGCLIERARLGGRRAAEKRGSGWHHSSTTRRKIGESQRGNVKSIAHREKLRSAATGKSPSMQTRVKLSIALRGRTKSSQTRARMRRWAKTRPGRESKRCAALIGNHVKWHTQRGVYSSACTYCKADKDGRR